MSTAVKNSQDVEARLQALGLVLPEPVQLPPDVRLPFAWVRVRGSRAFVSGHGPQQPDGSLAEPPSQPSKPDSPPVTAGLVTLIASAIITTE